MGGSQLIIGASLGSFKGLTLRQAMKLYSRLLSDFDLDAVELRFEKEENCPSLWPWESIGNNEIINFLNDFKVTGAHLPFAYINPMSPNPRIRNESMNQLKIGITKASELGMDYVTMHAQGVAHNLTYEQKCINWTKILTELAQYAEEYSIILTLENADFLSNLRDLAMIIREIDSKWLKITLDTGHAHSRIIPPLMSYPLKELALKLLDMYFIPFVTKKYMPYEKYGSVQNFLESEYGLIFSLHIHDHDGRNDHITIGTGKINFSFLSLLKRKDFSGPLILETRFKNHYTDFKKNYKNLKTLVNKKR